MQKVKSEPKVNWMQTFSLAKAKSKSSSKQPQNKANSDLQARVTAVTSVCRIYSPAKPKNKAKSELHASVFPAQNFKLIGQQQHVTRSIQYWQYFDFFVSNWVSLCNLSHQKQLESAFILV